MKDKAKEFSNNYGSMRMTLELMCEIPEENMGGVWEHHEPEYMENSENA